GIEAILEDVTSMPEDRRMSFIHWLGDSQDPRAVNLLLPLLESQPTRFVVEIIDALERLGTIGAPQSIPALNHLIATTSNRSVKQRARTTLGHLTMYTPVGTELENSLQPLPFYEGHISFIDGTGSQLIMLSWQRPDGLIKAVNVLYQDSWGIKDCYGSDEME